MSIVDPRHRVDRQKSCDSAHLPGRKRLVTHATMPGSLHRRSRFGLQRLDPIHQQTAFKLWERTRQTADYIGDWHTHPQVQPSPSSMDRREWGKITRAKSTSMIFAILGLQDWWIGIGQRKRLAIATQISQQ